jgi:hypothetical protein
LLSIQIDALQKFFTRPNLGRSTLQQLSLDALTVLRALE